MPLRSVTVRCYLPGATRPSIEDVLDAPPPVEQEKLVADLEPGTAAPRQIVASGSFVLAPMQL
jgi:hypothetical protein